MKLARYSLAIHSGCMYWYRMLQCFSAGNYVAGQQQWYSSQQETSKSFDEGSGTARTPHTALPHMCIT